MRNSVPDPQPELRRQYIAAHREEERIRARFALMPETVEEYCALSAALAHLDFGRFAELRCGAKGKRTGLPCQQRALYASGRCKYHGGLSTGPKTPEGKARSAANGKRRPAAPGVVSLSRKAFALFDERRSALREEVPALASLSEPFAAHVVKHAGLLGRLALTMHGIEHGREAPAVDLAGETMQRADRLLRRLMRHALAVFDMLAGGNSAAGLARRLALSILASEVQACTKHRLLQICRPFRNAEEPEQWAAVTVLEDAGWLLPAEGRQYRGRVSAWTIHPEVHTRFAAQAAKHRAVRRALAARLTEQDDDAKG